ncbi:molybdate ABC transporter substrate-binding protein [Mesobacillus zeae]|uniref:Molybdate ABC transporter substrate-binding protein n=2 Tax=Mesobacillus zeae TaxID=1917180 RepID=A0A398AXI9_9BACI|nr:molybdate ABC transporter substrate-binding protein [Mesobacillus zeae]RID82281.1 molybdate ABC transporter substrate-binding protein [Mesobacillus zeae]
MGLTIFIAMLLVFLVAGCSDNENTDKSKKQDKEKVELTVSAAASLQDALNEINSNFETDNPNIKVNFNYGGSGGLQQQISQGAPVDLFFSAAEDKFEVLKKEGRIEKDKAVNLVENELVLVVPKKSNSGIKTFDDLVKAKRIAIGTPESVPAGQYAKETLEYLNIWGKLEEKVIPAKDVRQVLTYVETNNVDAGIVYKTDAQVSSKVEMVATAKKEYHQPIIYPVGVVKTSTHQKEAALFYDYLKSEESLKILEKFGFKRVE